MLPESRTILLVEDSPDDRFLVEQAWRKAGIRNPLRSVNDGRKALEYLYGTGAFVDRKQHPLPALALVDIKMPELTGLEVLARVRGDERLRRLPVIIFTASTLAADVDEAYRLGANGFLVKPSTLQELVELLTALKNFFLRFIEFPAA